MSKTNFKSIARHQLSDVTGGVTRAAGAGTSDQTMQMQMMMSQIGDSIKSLAANNRTAAHRTSMMLPMMMMMMGGGGGGGASAAAAAPPPPPPAPAGTWSKSTFA